jgi:hypothetical protein
MVSSFAPSMTYVRESVLVHGLRRIRMFHIVLTAHTTVGTWGDTESDAIGRVDFTAMSKSINFCQ